MLFQRRVTYNIVIELQTREFLSTTTKQTLNVFFVLPLKCG